MWTYYNTSRFVFCIEYTLPIDEKKSEIDAERQLRAEKGYAHL